MPGGVSLRARLILLVITSVLPLLGFVLTQQYLSYKDTRAAASQQALDVARNMTWMLEQHVQTQIAILQVLALAPTLRDDNVAAFRLRLESILDDLLPGSNVLLFEENGQQVMNLALPADAPLPVRQTLDSLNQVFATGRPVVSNMFFGIATQRPVVSIEAPVKRADGSVRYSLAINPPLTGFAAIIRQRQAPESWVAAVFDGNGVIIARIPSLEQYIGQKASASFLPHLMSRHEGIVRSTTLEGIDVVSAFTHATGFNWSVGVGVPESSLIEPALQSATRTLAAGGALLLAGLGLAHLVARTISGPMASLRHLVASGRTDEVEHPAPTALRDVDEVMQAFRVSQERRRRSEEDERRAGLALRDSEARMRAVVDTAVDGVILIDTEGRMLVFNPACEKLFGYAAAEVIGQNVKMLMPPVFREEHDRYLDNYARTRVRKIIGIGREVTGRRKDGTTFPMHLSVGEAMHGGETTFIGTIHDLTERTQAERRVRELTAELVHTSRLSAMGQLSSSLAHELNQPLTAVMNYAEAARQMLAAMPGAAPAKVSGFLEKTAAQAERAGQIMRRLRSFVEKGPVERSAESLNRIVEEASALAATGARLDGIEVVSELAAALPPVEIDKIQIQQVVVNLVRNAVEVLQRSPQRRLVIRTEAAEAGQQQVSIIDSGPGIAPEIAAQLFKPFVTTKKDGMGIGLSISLSIIEAHGGRLWFEPNPEGGAIFRFIVPEAHATGSEP